MTFRHISELAGDVMRRVEIEAARNRGSDMRAPARPAVGGVGDRPALWEEAMRPVAFAREGTAQTGITGKVATTEAAAELIREDVKQRSEARWTAISASLLTASRNKRVAPPTRFAPALATRLFLVVNRAHSARSEARFAL